METGSAGWYLKLGIRGVLVVLAAVFTLFGVAGCGFAAYALVTRTAGLGGVVEYGIPLAAFVGYTYLVGSFFVDVLTGERALPYNAEKVDGIEPLIWRKDGLFTEKKRE